MRINRLEVGYEVKSFFGYTKFIEDHENDPERKELLKVFKALKKDHDFSVGIRYENGKYYRIFWDRYADHENMVLTVRDFELGSPNSYTDIKKSFDKVKADFLKDIKEEVE